MTFALTYDECRARFRRAADAAGVRCEAHRIEARGPESQALSLDVRTVTDLSRILAERSEHWLHRRGDRASADGRAIAWTHRTCSIPDSREWDALALGHGQRVLGDAIRGLFGSK